LSRLSRSCQLYYIRNCKGLKGILGLFNFRQCSLQFRMCLFMQINITFTTATILTACLLKRKHLYLCARLYFPKPQILLSDLCNEIHYAPALTVWGFMKRLNPTLPTLPPFWECHIPRKCVQQEKGASRASLREQSVPLPMQTMPRL